MDRPRQKPARLAEKLRHIRTALGLSQNGMIRRLGFEDELIQSHISAYERQHENRVPPLGVVLQYARCAGIEMEVLVDDNLELPEKLPISPKSGMNKVVASKVTVRAISNSRAKQRR